MEIVDTHAHLYSEDEARYPMKENPLRPPKGTGTVTHLRQVTRQSNVTRVVAVQTGSAYMYDNRFVADTVRVNRGWMTGVCTLDPDDPKSPSEMTRLVTGYGLRGVRVPVSEAKQPESLTRIWHTAQSLGVVVCAHFRGDHYAAMARLLERFPGVPVVLDHCAYPSVSEAPGHATLKSVLNLGGFRNLYAKLSFAVMASNEPYPCRDAHPLVRRVIEGFGPDRCIWGSGFPTELWLPKVTYEQHLRIFTEEMGLAEDEKRAVLETTPMRLWFPS